MRNKNLKQTKNIDSSRISDKYLGKDIPDNDGKDLDKHLQNLKLEHKSQIDNIITKNKKLLAILAHDIRSPMGLIIGYLDLLKDQIYTLEKSEIKAEVEIVLVSAKKSFNLLDNLLNWAINKNSMKSFQQEYSDIAILAREEMENIETFALQKQIKIYANNIPSCNVFIDKDMIKSVFRNLLHNAIKNTFIKGEIIISSSQLGEYIEVSIKDNGIGIKEEKRKIIFQPKNIELTLSDNNESRKGFGLLLSKEIIDMHGGKIDVLSKRGKGSEFKFTLPLGPV